MICVECSEPIESLYTDYKNGQIKLTDCPKCSKTADKYIEFDNVILFIDVLLLKPQAYRHLVFNLLNSKYQNCESTYTTIQNPTQSIKNWLLQNKKINRIRLLMVLFEIYLTWAYEEKNYNTGLLRNPYLVIHRILEKNVLLQYLYFSLKCIIEDLVTYLVVVYLIIHWLKWCPSDSQHSSRTAVLSSTRHILSLTILLSGGTKLFPILMLIWPYNNITITNVISSAADLNLAESLRIITGCTITESFTIFFFVSVLKFIVTRFLLIIIVTRGDYSLGSKYMETEFLNLWEKVHLLIDTFSYYANSSYR